MNDLTLCIFQTKCSHNISNRYVSDCVWNPNNEDILAASADTPDIHLFDCSNVDSKYRRLMMVWLISRMPLVHFIFPVRIQMEKSIKSECWKVTVKEASHQLNGAMKMNTNCCRQASMVLFAYGIRNPWNARLYTNREVQSTVLHFGQKMKISLSAAVSMSRCTCSIYAAEWINGFVSVKKTFCWSSFYSHNFYSKTTEG